MKKIHIKGFASVLLASLMTASIAYAVSPSTVSLGTADNFAILAGSAITNTGSSVVTGDVGIYPGTAVTGFPPATLNGIQHTADEQAIQAKSSVTATYTDASNRTPVTTIGTELGNMVILPGVYASPSGTFGLTGTVTLDAQGDPNAVFIFKSASTLITASGSNVVLANGAQACNVYWLVGSSATLGTNSTFRGSLIALTSITLTTNAHVEGRLLAQNGAVTLDSNTVTRASCAAPIVVVTPVVVTPTATTTVIVTPITTTTPTAATTVVVVPVPTQVIIPTLPNTGYAPNATPWNTIILAACVGILGSLYTLRKKMTL